MRFQSRQVKGYNGSLVWGGGGFPPPRISAPWANPLAAGSGSRTPELNLSSEELFYSTRFGTQVGKLEHCIGISYGDPTFQYRRTFSICITEVFLCRPVVPQVPSIDFLIAATQNAVA
jgi:hypothetical protein